jgi:hypothetical protein
MRRTLFTRCSFVVALLGAVTSQLASQATGTIEGHLTSGNGVPVLGASIMVTGTALSTRSGEEGHFVIRGVAEGVQSVHVQRVGFRPSDFSVTVSAGQTTALEVRLIINVVTLDTGRVTGTSDNGKPARLAYTSKYDEFYERRKSSGGRFFTHEEIEKKAATSLVDVFRTVSGMQVRRVSNHFELNVAGCPQANWQVFIDNLKVFPTAGEASANSLDPKGSPPILGNPTARMTASNTQSRLTPLDVLSDFSVEQIEALEVYTGSVNLPAVARGDGCAAIFVWTR